ncbi:hypothetical protein JRC04_05245 [Mycolicibacterium sp. S2-37]|uniref:hypothetical protein n=1 Tax=Mycolicibacterium sp. S2-37 TaxID=2810297 RepID=UPI001A948121|nr:hypothetical protein [Mycolicibacterium sp. S2-37]MBO0676860.1 hypothetical protein [Mycolicibacterium sp. S2-37]
MSEFTVYFSAGASTAVKVDAEDYDAAIEEAYNDLPGSLCHQCAREIELSGDWDVDAVYDADFKLVYEEKR